ncbi:hypothetical protein, partial [Photobacterium sp. R1]
KRGAITELEGLERDILNEDVKKEVTIEMNDYNSVLIEEDRNLSYPKSAKALVLDVKRKIEKGKLCEHAENREILNGKFEFNMKKISNKVLRYIEDFTWTI